MKRTKILYLEIAEKLRNDIILGKYPVGSLLPTENELEQLFSVSKITIRKAIELLASDEYVEKRSGKGTTVLSNRPYNKLAKAASFSQVLDKANLHLTTEVLSLDQVHFTQNDHLWNHFGEGAWLLRRLYLLEGQPYIYFSHYLPRGIEKEVLANQQETSLYRKLYLAGLQITRFEDQFKGISLARPLQNLLKTKAEIGIKRTRLSYDEAGQVVEYSEAIYDTSQQPYQIEYDI